MSRQIHLRLTAIPHGLQVAAQTAEGTFLREVTEAEVERLAAQTVELRSTAENGMRPLVDPVDLLAYGRALGEQCLPPELLAPGSGLNEADGSLVIATDDGAVPDLGWELLCDSAGRYVCGERRWSVCRRATPSGTGKPWVARSGPLRVLLVASSPEAPGVHSLDYEKEEEAILKATRGLGVELHLEVALMGSLDELRELVNSYRPHVLHLSGHGVNREGVGMFCFEDERGRVDERSGSMIALEALAESTVGCVFVSACQSAQAGVAGLCRTLVEQAAVPVAIGWGASIADDRATAFAQAFYRELSLGRSVPQAVVTARRKLFEACRLRLASGREVLDLSFALPELFSADGDLDLVDRASPRDDPERDSFSYRDIGDGIAGLREGFVGRRRILQRTQPALRTGELNVVVLTGIGGAGKSTLATRLVNRFARDGWRVVALKVREQEQGAFGLRLVQEVAVACQRIGRLGDETMLRDGQRPLGERLRLVVEILNEARLLLVLDNLESLLPQPPAARAWLEPELHAFFVELGSRLTGEGRAILTCRYALPGLAVDQSQVRHEAMPDFSLTDFEKYLRRQPEVVARNLPPELWRTFHRKFGATPRFLKQACEILAREDPDRLAEQLETAPDAAMEAGEDQDRLRELQRSYFDALFLPGLFEAVDRRFRPGLCRLAVLEIAVPEDVAGTVTGLAAVEVGAALQGWLDLGLVQRWAEDDSPVRWSVYPLQRVFWLGEDRLSARERLAAHQAAAMVFQEIFEKDREEELQIGFMTGLLACREHAMAAGDDDLLAWATETVGHTLRRVGEYRSALALYGQTAESVRERPEMLVLAGQLHLSLGDWKVARNEFCRAQVAYGAIGNRAGEAATWHNLASIDLNEGNYQEAREKFGKSLAINQAIGDRAGEAATWHQLATIDVNEGNYGEAREKFGKALVMRQAIGDRPGEAGTWHNLATIDLNEGNYGAAREKFRKSLAINQAIGDRAGEAATWHQLATIELREGNYGEAREKFGKSLAIRQAIGDRKGEAGTLYQIGMVARAAGRGAMAVRLLAIAHAIEDGIGAAGEAAVSWRALCGVASELGLDQAGFDAMRQEAFEAYRADRGAALVAAAFADPPPET